jgi:Uma2 family endonuclease
MYCRERARAPGAGQRLERVHTTARVAWAAPRRYVCAMDAPARKWTRVEYERLAAAEVLGPEDRVELVGGAMLCKEPQDSLHAAAILLAHRILSNAFGPARLVRVQMPVALDDESEPEPDLTVVPGAPRDYRDAHPTRPVLIVDVARSHLAFDRDHKGSLYARAGVGEYWIVNLLDRRLEVFCDPVRDAAAAFGWRYGAALALGPHDHVAPLAATTASIAVADLLP